VAARLKIELRAFWQFFATGVKNVPEKNVKNVAEITNDLKR